MEDVIVALIASLRASLDGPPAGTEEAIASLVSFTGGRGLMAERAAEIRRREPGIDQELRMRALDDAGALEALLGAMEAHPESAPICRDSLMVVRNIAANLLPGSGFDRTLAAGLTPSFISSVMKRFIENVDVCTFACSLVAAYSSNAFEHCARFNPNAPR